MTHITNNFFRGDTVLSICCQIKHKHQTPVVLAKAPPQKITAAIILINRTDTNEIAKIGRRKNDNGY